MSAKKTLGELALEKIIVLDGAMGTMIQQHELTETDFRGELFNCLLYTSPSPRD